MSAYKRYFTWLNRMMDNKANRGFLVNWFVSSFCWFMCIFGLSFFFMWFLLWLGWKSICVVCWLIRVVFYLLRVMIAKIRKKDPLEEELPTFPTSHSKSLRNMTGVDFERYVADKLRARGYHDVRFTPATGDYGVDILATKRGKVYAFQCKCYTGSVGVSAVQEVFSGSRKYQADKAVVITNSRYTPNARTLAGDLGVSLWDLAVLDSIFCE